MIDRPSPGRPTAPPAPTRFPYGVPVAVTRRSSRFAALADAIEVECARRGIVIPPGHVDAVLNRRINQLAYASGVTPRAALELVDDTMVRIVTQELVTSSRSS